MPHPVLDRGRIHAEGALVEDGRVLDVVLEVLEELLGYPGFPVLVEVQGQTANLVGRESAQGAGELLDVGGAGCVMSPGKCSTVRFRIWTFGILIWKFNANMGSKVSNEEECHDSF